VRSRYLVIAAAIGLAAAVALGAIGVTKLGWVLVPFIVVGPLILIAYNAELFGGLVHNDVGFAAAWGAFPVLTAYVAQAETLTLAPVLAALGAFGLSLAQRRLSTPARALRRRSEQVEGTVTDSGGKVHHIDRSYLLAPLEGALRALTWSTVLFAAALAVARMA
jgi:asparagine N-glycosylation enzyme membrane subunit Stt3